MYAYLVVRFDYGDVKNMQKVTFVVVGKIKESRTMDRAVYELLGEDLWQTT